jgi:hypothetical protein
MAPVPPEAPIEEPPPDDGADLAADGDAAAAEMGLPIEFGGPLAGHAVHPVTGQPIHPVTGRPLPPAVHPVTGQPIHPVTGQPLPPADGHPPPPIAGLPIDEEPPAGSQHQGRWIRRGRRIILLGV